MSRAVTAGIADGFLHSLDNCRVETEPYRHWLLSDMITDDACAAIAELPIAPPSIGDMLGKRDTYNESRTFFSPDIQRRYGVCAEVAAALQESDVVRRLEQTCGVALKGSYLRIEYCQDVDGFWLDPHTDISVKLFTMLVHLSKDPDASGWGTDIYRTEHEHFGIVPYAFNTGMIFIPASDTWHGFRRRPISGVRKILIVNYVTDDWRAREELAFPDRPVG